MQYTTFADEVVLYQHANGEALVEVTQTLAHESKRIYVAVTADGYRTDYPIWTGTGVLWDNPEWFTCAFRVAATKRIADLQKDL